MKTKRDSVTGALVGLIGIGLIGFATSVRLASAAGKPADTVSFSGTWERDAERSDDPQEKFQEAMARMREQMGRQGGGFGGGGRRGGSGGGGRRGGEGGRSGGPQGMQERMGSLIAAFESLDIEHEAGELRIDTGERLSIYYLDGEKHRRDAPDGSKIEVTAEIRGLSVVIKEKMERGVEVNRTFELSPTGEVMIMTVNFKSPRGGEPIVIKTVYELVE